MSIADYRLSAFDKGRLADASRSHYDSWAAENRVPFYLRRGYDLADAVEYAIAWAKNMTEQYDRRLSHATGAEGWRAIE